MCHFAGFETKQRMASDSSPCTQGCCQGTIEGRGYTLSCVLAYRHEHKRPENGLYRSVGADFWFHIYLRLATWSNRPIKRWPVVWNRSISPVPSSTALPAETASSRLARRARRASWRHAGSLCTLVAFTWRHFGLIGSNSCFKTYKGRRGTHAAEHLSSATKG